MQQKEIYCLLLSMLKKKYYTTNLKLTFKMCSYITHTTH